MEVRLGKALEWEYLQCWSMNHSGKPKTSSRTRQDLRADTTMTETEWHFIPEGDTLPLETLWAELMEAMSLFPHLTILDDMDMTASQSTINFASIMERLEDYENTPRWDE
jgi:hypothetical protein